MRYNTIQYNAINTIQNNKIQYRTTQDKTKIKKDQKELKYEFFYQNSTNQNNFSEKRKKSYPVKNRKFFFYSGIG